MSASGLSVGTEVVPESTPMRKRGLRLNRIQWVGVFLAAVFVVSVLRVVTGANDIVLITQGVLVLSIVVAYEIVRRYRLAAEQRSVAEQLAPSGPKQEVAA